MNMASSLLPNRPRVTLSAVAKTELGPVAEAANRRIAEHAAAQRSELAPAKVAVALDQESQRFISTLTDTSTARDVAQISK